MKLNKQLFTLNEIVSLRENEQILFHETINCNCWNENKKTLFLNSILNQLPVNYIILVRVNTKYIVIDGYERLTAVCDAHRLITSKVDLAKLLKRNITAYVFTSEAFDKVNDVWESVGRYTEYYLQFNAKDQTYEKEQFCDTYVNCCKEQCSIT